jgi:hypothetical protein
LLHRGDFFAFEPPAANAIISTARLRPPYARGVVLNDLSEQIRECFRHAEACAQKAGAQTDPKIKADFLALEQRWLYLARSYEFTERLTDFSTRGNGKPKG